MKVLIAVHKNLSAHRNKCLPFVIFAKAHTMLADAKKRNFFVFFLLNKFNFRKLFFFLSHCQIHVQSNNNFLLRVSPLILAVKLSRLRCKGELLHMRNFLAKEVKLLFFYFLHCSFLRGKNT